MGCADLLRRSRQTESNIGNHLQVIQWYKINKKGRTVKSGLFYIDKVCYQVNQV